MRRAERIVVLDRFVKHRIVAKGIPEEKIDVIPPWPTTTPCALTKRAGKHFAARTTWRQVRGDVCRQSQSMSSAGFGSTGGATAKRARRHQFCFCRRRQRAKQGSRVCARQSPDKRALYAISTDRKTLCLAVAADLHLVVMGERFPGIVHPSKIYNLLAIESPFLYIGPAESHLDDIISRLGDRHRAFHVRHGKWIPSFRSSSIG